MRLLSLIIFTLMTGFAFSAPNRAYVGDGETVVVIDTTTNTVIQTIPGFMSVFDLIITPDGAFVYITDTAANSVAVIDTATNTQVAIITGIPSPNGITMSPNGQFAYVVGSLTDVYVINTKSNTVIATITGSPGFYRLAASPNGNFVYVVNRISNSIAIINTAINAVTGSPIAVGATPTNITINSSGTIAYVTHEGVSDVAILDLTNNTLSAMVQASGSTHASAIIPNGELLYVTSTSGVLTMNTATNSFVGYPIAVGDEPASIAFTSDGLFAYVVNTNDKNVSVINTTTNSVVGQPIEVGSNFALGIVIAPSALAPINLTGVQKKGADSWLQKEFLNILNWQKNPNSITIGGYYVYRNGTLIATLNGSTTQYVDHNSPKGQATLYTVVAIATNGAPGGSASVTTQ